MTARVQYERIQLKKIDTTKINQYYLVEVPLASVKWLNDKRLSEGTGPQTTYVMESCAWKMQRCLQIQQ